MREKEYTSKEIAEGLKILNNEVFEYVNAIYRHRVIQLVCDNSGIKQDGEDLYQETFKKVYLNVERGSYNPERDFGAYFMSIANYTWIDMLRKRNAKKNIKTVPVDAFYEQLSDKEAQNEHQHETLNLHKYIAKLKEKEKKVIRLFYFENKSYKDIADEMGMTEGSARVKMNRIREKLRKMMKPQTTDFLT